MSLHCIVSLTIDVAFRNGQVGDSLFLGNMAYTVCFARYCQAIYLSIKQRIMCFFSQYVIIVVCLKAGLESDSWTLVKIKYEKKHIFLFRIFSKLAYAHCNLGKYCFMVCLFRNLQLCMANISCRTRNARNGKFLFFLPQKSDPFFKATYVFASPCFWFGLFLIPITALLADFIYNW